MSGNVPKVDPDLSMSAGPDRQQQLELELLEADAKARNLSNRDADQRFALKWIAIVVGLAVIAGMVFFLWHVSHKLFLGPFMTTSPGFAVAAIVAPVTAITTITVVILVGAFRQFSDADLERMGHGVAGAVSAARMN